MWSNSDTLSGLALLVSCSSFGVSALTYWKQHRAEQPNAWFEFSEEFDPEQFQVVLKFQNPSKRVFSVTSVRVPLRSYPLSEKQDFFFVNDSRARSVNVARDFGASDLFTVQPGEVQGRTVWLRRGRLSDAQLLKASINYVSHEAKPKMRTMRIQGRIPTPALMLSL